MPKVINPHFVKPTEKWSESLEYPDEYKRELKSFELIHIKPEVSDDGKRLIRHWINRSKYPEHTHTTLCRIFRVKIKPGQFELEDGTVAPPDKTPSQVIVASFSEYTDSPEYIQQGGETGLEVLSGEYYTKFRYPKHLGRFTYDENGNILNSLEIGHKYMYTKAYSPGAIRELLNSYKHDRTLSFACVVANPNTGGEPFVGNPRTVKNLKYFIEIDDIDGLIEANDTVDEHKKSFLVYENGYQRWQKIKEKKIAEGQQTTKRQYRKPEETNAST